jgi:disulfide oxidoreductase YuzD
MTRIARIRMDFYYPPISDRNVFKRINLTNIMKDALEYFRANFADMIAKFEGEYVAIIEDKIITHGKDAKKVYQEAKDKFPKKTIFLGQVPRKEAMIL